MGLEILPGDDRSALAARIAYETAGCTVHRHSGQVFRHGR